MITVVCDPGVLGVPAALKLCDPCVTKLLGSCGPVILGILECLVVEFALGVTGLAVEFMPKANQPRKEVTHATGWTGFLCPWIPLVPGKPGGVLTDVRSSSPLVL